jgi:hypothetical protein
MLSLLGFGSAVISGCSSSPTLPSQWTLKTTSKTQNYYYCESCPQASKLTNQVYQPLEPDTPVVAVAPVALAETPIKPIKITKPQRSHPQAHQKFRHRHKRVQSKPKQCIQWSY